MKRPLLFGLAGMLTIGLLALGTPVVLAQTPPGLGSCLGATSAGYDIGAHFIQHMIPHHEDAVTMARLAATQAEHPELRQLAQSISQSQSAEIAQMREWYGAWYGAEVPPCSSWGFGGTMGGRGWMMGGAWYDPASIDGQVPFDKAFIEAMAPHHVQAIVMSRMMLRGVQQPELRALLENIISSQTAGLQQMREWYREWYGATLPTGYPGVMMPGLGPQGPRSPGMAPGWGPGHSGWGGAMAGVPWMHQQHHGTR